MIPIGAQTNPVLDEEAKKILRRGLGRAELEFAASVTAPFFWVLRGSDGIVSYKNGSVFFLDAGSGVFAVTANHVVQECMNDTKSSMFVQSVIGGHGRTVKVNIGDRIIDGNEKIDIATFRVTREEIHCSGCTILTGIQSSWPPPLPEPEQSVTCCGFPGSGRKKLAPNELAFGRFGLGATVSSVHERCISILVERENLRRVLGAKDMPENYDFGGMSGGPVIAIAEMGGIRSWMPAGVIFQGPNSSTDPSQSILGLEIIRARPIQFIMADGSLDLDRWRSLIP